ncbi:MAG: hypothetical protein HY699_22570, partial [Deltaproteobacteria bacterium]|nr:hypothetical protein [Deltaproteobacteria bacterium]
PATAPTEGLLSGWTFLSDADARAASAGKLASAGTQFIHRPGVEIPGGRAIAETLENLFRLKHELLPQLKNIPYVQEDTPIVCAWYPEARSVLLWDLSGREQAVTVRRGDTSYNVSVAPLDAGLVEGI